MGAFRRWGAMGVAAGVLAAALGVATAGTLLMTSAEPGFRADGPPTAEVASGAVRGGPVAFSELVAGVMMPVAVEGAAHAPKVVEYEGLQLSFALKEGPRGAVARLVVTDAEGGEPVRGLKPRAWLEERGEDGPQDAAACGARVQELRGGGLAERAEEDLNALRVLLLNDDDTLSVLNPQIALRQTRLEALLRLPGEVLDWALHPDGRSLYLSVPNVKQVLVVETQGFRVASTLELDEAPGALAFSEDGRQLWVGGADANAAHVQVIDTDEDRVVGAVEVGPGPHQVVVSHGGHQVWVASPQMRELVAIDGPSARYVGAVAVGEGVVSLGRGCSTIAVAREGGEVRVFDVARGSDRRVQVAAGVTRVDVAPGERWAFALHAGAGQVSVIDLEHGVVRGAFQGLGAPERVVFTEGYAYIERAAGEQVGMVALDALAKSGPGLRWVSTGEVGVAGAGASAVSAAPGPAGRSIFVASPNQRAILVLAEGQPSPMGRIDNRVGRPRAMMLLDRSLEEVAPGVYRASAEVDLARSWELRLDLGDELGALCF
ncbi:YncE family protein [Lujinxingia vulgaris]|uniref:YncE family protein n=1 Tax=Lujinxingia vulgaris TaxID=2600176 RepID=A0A5C6XBK4_9DELT|nr:YncE family protein [Lujinxingia vulgaris]TXD34515.1 YncE family protein [Lujinxingia vulgaris]